MTQHLYNFFFTCSESTNSTTKSFTQSSGNHISFAYTVVLFGNTATCSTNNTCRVTFVNHHQSIILVGQFHNLIHWRSISIHRENAVRNNYSETLFLCFFQLCLQVFHVSIDITIALCLAKTHTIYNRSVI